MTADRGNETAYDALPRIEKLGMPHAWEALDRDLGTLTRMTPETVREAAGLVREGETFGLNLPLTEIAPPLFGRDPVAQEVFATDRNTLDDRLDSFYPQGSTQWDGLRHVRAREFGFFGGVTDAGFAADDERLGIGRWTDAGIVGRGLLLDVVAHREQEGRAWDPFGAEPIEAEELREIVAAQEVEPRPGDVLLIRTGWIAAYRALDQAGREAQAGTPSISGLAGSDDVARFLWDSGAIAVAADNPTLEVAPGDPAVGSLHRRLIPLLGFVVGELLDLDRLASRCAADSRWDFLFTAMPLNLPGGVGSPANAMAIR
ncbi:MAG: cyclase family protein [Actinobacteria bacterium]|nr:cyclase family protein [Actinomycetota bacterium]